MIKGQLWGEIREGSQLPENQFSSLFEVPAEFSDDPKSMIFVHFYTVIDWFKLVKQVTKALSISTLKHIFSLLMQIFFHPSYSQLEL